MELIIKPRKRLRLDWREIWAFRELFYFFAWRDIKVRYKQTVVGAAWAIFQPFISMVIFTVFFNKIAGITSGSTLPYPIFAYTGLLFWNYFSNALTNASNSLVENKAIVSKVYFPRLIAPLSSTLAAGVDFAFAAVIFAILMAYFEIVPTVVGVVLILPMLLITFATAAGLGMFLAAINVKYRDVQYALPFLIQSLLFLTPVIYPVSLVPPGLWWLLYLNPLTGVITTMRATLLHSGAIYGPGIALSVIASVGFFLFGLWYFGRREREFADIL